MDEPTAALSPHEVDEPLRDRSPAARARRRDRLHQPSARGGRRDRRRRHRPPRRPPRRDAPGRRLCHGEIVRLMVGRSLDALFPKEEAEIGDVVLRVEASTRAASSPTSRSSCGAARSSASPASSGAGRSEVARAIFGIDRPRRRRARGSTDRRFRPRSPRAALRRGLAYLPEDRLQQGLVQPMSIAQNTSMAVLPRADARRRPAAAARAALARRFMEQLAHQGDVAGAGRAKPFRRQPAEGRALEVARRRAADPDPRRADARRRRGHEGGRPPHDLAPRRAGLDDPAHLLGAARDPRHERPRARDARGPARRRALARRSDAGAGDRGQRPASEAAA